VAEVRHARKASAKTPRRRAVTIAIATLGAAAMTFGAGSAFAVDQPSGTTSPPAWSADRFVHFDPGSAATSGWRAGLPTDQFAGPPPPFHYFLGPLLYLEGGGHVEHSPHVYAIFWGSKWNSAPGTEAKATVLKLFEGLSNSAYQGMLTQYFDATGRIGKTVATTAYVDTAVTAPTKVTDAKVQAEIAKAIETNGWGSEINNQFIVFPAPGSTYETGFDTKFCGYHARTTEGVTGAAYGFVAYPSDEPFSTECLIEDAEKSPIHKVSKTASHEYAEIATNPEGNMWRSENGAEIADICVGEPDFELPGGGWAQLQQDNHVNNCAKGDLEPPFVYVVNKRVMETTETTAKLEGTVNPENTETTYFYEWGLTKTYGSKTSPTSAGSGHVNQAVSTTLSGLAKKTEYHWRMVATNSTGTNDSIDRTFTTK
jgi:hypothetical protein